MNSFPRHLRGPRTAEPTLIAVVLTGGGVVMSLLPLTAQVTSLAIVVGGGCVVAAVRGELRIRRRLRAIDERAVTVAEPVAAPVVAGVLR